MVAVIVIVVLAIAVFVQKLISPMAKRLRRGKGRRRGEDGMGRGG